MLSYVIFMSFSNVFYGIIAGMPEEAISQIHAHMQLTIQYFYSNGLKFKFRRPL